MNGQQVYWEIRQRLEDYGRYNDFNTPESPPKDGSPAYPVPDRKYILIAHINHGTYGSVWKAHHAEDPNHIVAIKFFPRYGGRQAGMVKELEGIRRLSSQKGFIQLIDFNNQNTEWPYLVMTYAPLSLESVLKEGPLPVRRAVRVFTQVVEAMAFAHSDQLGMCHCDLKPSNVLLTMPGNAGEPLIADLGQSRLLSHGNRGILGSFFYMPPEQANLGNKTVDKRWDVYALGAIAYGMLVAGQPPLPSLPRKDKHWETLEPTLRREDLLVQLVEYQKSLEQAGRPDGHWKVPGIDSRLASIIDRCLELKPESRFRDAVAIAEALRARKRACQRGPILRVGLIATILAFAVVIGLGWTFQKRVVQQQQTELIQQIQDGEEQTAAVAARLLETKLQRRVRFLERYTDLPITPTTPPAPGTVADKFLKARAALVRARHTGRERHHTVLLNRWLAEDREPVDDWLRRIVDDAHKEDLFSHGITVSVCMGDSVYNFSRGYRDPESGTVTANPWQNERSVRQYTSDFSYRDWYGRTGYTLQPGDDRIPGQPRKPIDSTHISVLYLSTHGTWWLSVVSPIRAVDPDTGQVEVVGLLGGPVDIDNELTKWLDKPADHAKATSPFQGDLKKIVVDDRGHLIWHPELTHLIQDDPNLSSGAGSSHAGTSDLWDGGLAQPVYERCVFYRQYAKQFQDPNGQPNEEIDLFNDLWDDPRPAAGAETAPVPVTSESATPPGGWLIARRAKFYPLGEEAGKDPWYVIVAVVKDEAMQPVAALQKGLLWQGLLAFAVFLTLSACIWGGVLWALNSSEGSGHA